MTELVDEFAENEEMKQDFIKNKSRTIEIFQERGLDVQLGLEDFQLPEEVINTEKTGESRYREGYLYREEVSESKCPSAKNAK